jgi:hypothetical protein
MVMSEDVEHQDVTVDPTHGIAAKVRVEFGVSTLY